MSAPVKMGMVVTQPTAFIERNPHFVAHVRRNMERDIRDSGRLIDSESWTREELDGFPAPMTRFTLDAVSQAHVIVHITKEGRSQSTEVVEVQIGTRDAAWARAKALDEERGHDAWDYHAVETAPLGYPTPELQVTQEFKAQSTTDRMRDIRIGTERMRG
jgi:hypothetical protein